jgi:thiol-disulfide isomerase/thioredoxin
MNKIEAGRAMAVVLFGCLVSASAAQATDRTADEILAELDTVKLPSLQSTKRGDDADFADYVAKLRKATEKRAALVLELYEAAPDHERIPVLLVERWNHMSPVAAKSDELKKEIDRVLSKTTNPILKLEGTYLKARIKLLEDRSTGAPDIAAIDEFIKLAPQDSRGVSLLYAASSVTRDEQAKTALEHRIVKDFPDSPYGELIEGVRRTRDALGKPFDLEFTDAIKGSSFSIKGWKGKVVVIEFWATTCGSCVADMPNMKGLYAKYHDKGVEFIGISLDKAPDEGGLDALKKFVADNGISWPQYYQGKAWDSDFSKSCGVHVIPTVFVVDGEGKLISIDARGKLDTMLPELLKTKRPSIGAATGGNGN